MGAAVSVNLTPLPKWVSSERYAELAGITKKAIDRKRQEGVWREGIEWVKAPDGLIRINWRAVDSWIEGNPDEPPTNPPRGRAHSRQ